MGLDKLVERDPITPWHKVAGLRNILAHEYLGIDQELLWGTIKKHLPGLRDALEAIATAF